MAAIEAPGAGASYRLATDRYPSGELSVVSFRGVEQLSRPYSFRILVTGTGIDSASFERDLMGRSAHLQMTGPSETHRFVHGIVRRTEVDAVSGGADGRHHFRVWIAPRLWLLGQNKNSRIFQDLSVKAIVDLLLSEAGIEHRWDLIGTSAPRDYCVQHQESDLHFVSRLLAEEGISYFFEHSPEDEAGSETLVLSDTALLAKPITGEPDLPFSDSGGMVESGEHVRRFRLRGKLAPGTTLLSEFDFTRPSFDVSATAATPPDDLRVGEAAARVYDHHGEFFGATIDARVAALRLEQHRRKVKLGAGESRCRRLVPGAWFELSGNPVPDLDGRYTVLRVEHEGHDLAGMRHAGSSAPARDVYMNRFVGLPDGVACRPRPVERRIQQVLETAVVVGPEGQEIHTDSLGRIKVQFHWDREGKRNERSSCWIRTMQGWAGTGWGFQFIPRIGMEVLVQFLGGDTDRPMVMGCVYNAEHPPPFPLPADKTKSGIRTQSSVHGGGGHNELSFEDKADAERVFLRAQRNLDEAIGKNHTTTVGNDQTTRIGENQSLSVGGNRVETIALNRSGAVGGERSQQVGGDDRLTVGGRRVEKIAGSLTQFVDGDLNEFVGGAARTHLDQSHLLRVVGKQDVLIGTPDEAKGALLDVWGQYRAAASTDLILEGQKTVVLKCGGSRIVLTPDDIRLVSKKVWLACKDEMLVDAAGAQLKLDGDGYLNGKKVQIHSSGASGIFDGDARLDGSFVKLNCGPDGAGSGSEPDEAQQEAQTLTLAFADGEGQPHADKRYELLVEGTTLKGTTGKDGKVSQQIASSATKAVLTLWVSDKRKVVYQIDVGPLPPVETVRGALLRLRNLQYYTGDVGDELTDEAKRALRYFQYDRGIPTTGQLDNATTEKLEEAAHR